MLNAQVVMTQLKKVPGFERLNEADYRGAIFGQKFTPPAGGDPTVFQPRPFANGAIILGIAASAFIPNVAANENAGRNRQLFALDFAFQGGEALVIDGPIMADALLGGGDNDNFPAKAIVVGQGQQILCRAANLTIGALTIHVSYSCLVWRFPG